MEPGESLQIAGSVLAGKLEGDFITARSPCTTPPPAR